MSHKKNKNKNKKSTSKTRLICRLENRSKVERKRIAKKR
jgi:hypothetical protein